MNAGMYKQDNSPLGLFIDKKKIVTALDTTNGNGNFYLKPNGVFYITINNIAAVCTTEKLANYDAGYAGIFRKLSEGWKLEIRGEALNATNTPHFNNPGANVDNLQKNPDGSIRALNGFTEITSVNTRREGIDERVLRIGMHIRF